MTVAGQILALFGTIYDGRVLSTTDIIEQTRRIKGTIYTVLKRMVENGDLVRARYGMYHLPDVTPTMPVPPARNGMSGRLLELERRVAELEARAK